MDEKKIDWELDDEELDIIKSYVEKYTGNKYLRITPFEMWESWMREDLIEHHERKVRGE